MKIFSICALKITERLKICQRFESFTAADRKRAGFLGASLVMLQQKNPDVDPHVVAQEERGRTSATNRLRSAA